MSQVIDSFLVALGFDIDDESVKEGTQAIDNIRSGALAMGAALASALTAGGYAAKKTAQEITDLEFQARLLSNVSANDLDRLGFAISQMGGGASEAAPLLANLESILTNYNKLGQLGPLEDLAKLGIPVEFLADAKSSLDMLDRIAAIIPALEPEIQKSALEALGFGDGAKNLVIEGPDNYSALMARAGELATLNENLISSSTELTQAFGEMGRSVTGLFRSFTEGAAPGMTKSLNEWTEAFTEFNDEIKTLGEWFSATSKFLSPDNLDPTNKGSYGDTFVSSLPGGPVLKAGGWIYGKWRDRNEESDEDTNSWFGDWDVLDSDAAEKPSDRAPLVQLPDGSGVDLGQNAGSTNIATPHWPQLTTIPTPDERGSQPEFIQVPAPSTNVEPLGAILQGPRDTDRETHHNLELPPMPRSEPERQNSGTADYAVRTSQILQDIAQSLAGARMHDYPTDGITFDLVPYEVPVPEGVRAQQGADQVAEPAGPQAFYSTRDSLMPSVTNNTTNHTTYQDNREMSFPIYESGNPEKTKSLILKAIDEAAFMATQSFETATVG